MRKEFGKWLMDIAKYLATAVFISSVFSKMEDAVFVYSICLFGLLLTLCLGLMLVKEPKVLDKNA